MPAETELRIVRTGPENKDYVFLTRLLDAELARRDGDDAPFFQKHNKSENVNAALVGYVNNEPVSCGALRPYENRTVEIKRMYTVPGHTRKGYAMKILKELEKVAKELGYERCILETGKAMPEAIALYEKCGYKYIPNYGPYVNVPSSVCLEKRIDLIYD